LKTVIRKFHKEIFSYFGQSAFFAGVRFSATTSMYIVQVCTVYTVSQEN